MNLTEPTWNGRALTPKELEACRNLLWHYGDRELGWEPGGFTSSLISALEKADVWNRLKLLGAFAEFEPGVSALLNSGLEGLQTVIRAEQGEVAAQ